jgi:hypothetical protein
MVLERVNEKKKRSNISNGGECWPLVPVSCCASLHACATPVLPCCAGCLLMYVPASAAGTNELIFTPKFLTKTKDATQQQQQPQPQQRREVQRHPSQSSSCSTLSAEGPMRFCSNSSMGSVGSAGTSGRDSTRMSDRGCGLVANGYMAQFAIDTINSSECNAVSSGSLLQPGGATAAGACGTGGAGQVCSGSNLCSGNNLALVNSGQLLMAEHPGLGSFEQQLQQQQQQQQQAQHALNMEAAARGTCVGQQHTAQAWRQQWQAAGTLDEACAAAAGGAYLPSFRQLQGSQMLPPDAALSAAVAYAAMQPTSLSILAGPQQEQLGMQLTLGDANKISCGPSVLPMHGHSSLGGVMNAAAFEGMAMMPAGGAAGDSMGLPSLPSAFAANDECFSTYSNFLDGHPSMQLPTVGASGHFASLSAAANAVADAAAAADCSASLFTSGNFASGAHASGAMLGCVMQQQQQRQLQQHAALQSGSNLQLSNGALYQVAGGLREGMGDLAEMQKQHLLQLDGEWAGAGDSEGYFDLYRSGSSLDSMKADETTGTSSCSYPNKLSSCSSSETRHTLGPSAAAVALARQQQEQLLTISEQRKLQLAGLPVSQAALQQMVNGGSLQPWRLVCAPDWQRSRPAMAPAASSPATAPAAVPAPCERQPVWWGRYHQLGLCAAPQWQQLQG